MKTSVKIISAAILGAQCLWGGVTAGISGNSAFIKNETGEDFLLGMRIWGQKLNAGDPFKFLQSDAYNGKDLHEYWLASHAQPMRAGGAASLVVWSGGIPAGNTAEPLVKTGVCNEPPPRCDENPITLEELQDLLKNDPNYYKESYRYKGGDYMGKHGGMYSAGIFDSYCGETQFQFAVPTVGWRFSNTDVKFNENNGGKGPMLWMALSANQEYFGTDLQVLISTGMKESWLLTNQALQANVHAGGLTAYHIEPPTYGDQVMGQYPGFFPHGLATKDYVGWYPSATDAVKVTEGQLSINSAFSSGLLWQSYYEQLSKQSNLAFKQVLENSVSGGDPLIGFCAMSFMYNQGPISAGLPDMFLPSGKLSTIIDNPNACEDIAAAYSGFGNYVETLKKNAKVLEEASKKAETDASVKILDRDITLEEVQRFWFGGDIGNPGTPQMEASARDGGLLQHYDLSLAEREALWNDVKAAFTMQAAKWGGNKISLRYDWLSNLRVVKARLPRKISASFTFSRQAFIEKYSTGDYDGNGYRMDTKYPFMDLTAIPATDPEGFAVNVKAVDPRQYDRGIEKVEWSVHDDWSVFSENKVSFVSGTPLEGTHKIDLSKSDYYSVLGDEGGDLWVRVSDSCGNTVAQKIKIKGVKLPKLLKAWIIDQDGDGNGDKIFVDTEEKPDQTDSLYKKTGMTYSWPNNENPINSSLGLIGTQYIIEDFTLKGGAADGLGGEVVVDLNGYKLKVTIADSVGPVIQYAGVQEDNPDILYVMFSENITSISGVGPYINISGTDVALDGVKQSENNPRQWVFDLSADLDVKRLENSLDSVRIIPGNISDALGNGAHNKNPNVAIILDKGPLEVADSGMMYLDTDIDGIMDRVVLRFKQPAVGRTGTMRLTFKWPDSTERFTVKEFTVEADQLVVDDDDPYAVYYDASNDGLRPYTTYFDLNKDEWGWAELHQESLTPDVIPSRTDTLNMQDGMGPIIEIATYGESRYPDRRPDTLAVKFSEPVDTSAENLFHNQLYWFKTADLEPRNGEHYRPDSAKRVRKSGAQLNIYFSAVEHLERPGIGDSIKIFSETGVTGTIRDPYGNRAEQYNPWALIEGVVRTIIHPGDLWYITSTDLDQTPADTVIFYDYTVDLDSIVKERPGIGFALAFSDSVDETDRKNQTFGYTVRYFSNLGGYVSSQNKTFNCVDMQEKGVGEFLLGACNPKLYPASRKVKVFIPWNAKSDEGVRVGAGAYIQQLHISGSRIEKLDATRLIGVVRVPEGQSRINN